MLRTLARITSRPGHQVRYFSKGTFVHPFQTFVRYEAKIRCELQTLESGFAEKERMISALVKNRIARAKNTKPSAERKHEQEHGIADRPKSGVGTPVEPPATEDNTMEKLVNDLTAEDFEGAHTLRDLRLLVQCIEQRLEEPRLVWKQIEAGMIKRIKFPYLCLLFNLGDVVVSQDD